MKKLGIGLVVGVIVLIILGVLGFAFFLDGIVKKGVETVGPQLTKTELRLNDVSLSVLGGSAKLKGLFVGNPEGYKSPSAIEADAINVALVPKSVLSDKVIVRSVRIDGARINVEGSPSDNNLTKILASVQSATGGGGSPSNSPKDTLPGKKLQVDDLVISNVKLSLTLKLLGGKTTTASIPDIHLSNLGQGPEGITPKALTEAVLSAITSKTAPALLDAAKNLGGTVTDTLKDLGKGKTEGLEKATQGIKDLFKKKP